MVDVETGLLPNADTKNTIYESFKSSDNFLTGLENLSNKDKLGKYDSKNNTNILRFY